MSPTITPKYYQHLCNVNTIEGNLGKIVIHDTVCEVLVNEGFTAKTIVDFIDTFKQTHIEQNRVNGCYQKLVKIAHPEYFA